MRSSPAGNPVGLLRVPCAIHDESPSSLALRRIVPKPRLSNGQSGRISADTALPVDVKDVGRRGPNYLGVATTDGNR